LGKSKRVDGGSQEANPFGEGVGEGRTCGQKTRRASRRKRPQMWRKKGATHVPRWNGAKRPWSARGMSAHSDGGELKG